MKKNTPSISFRNIHSGPRASGPGPEALAPLWMLIKIMLGAAFFIWVRATLPRYRYDQLMRLGWKVLIPLAIANLVLTGIVKVMFQ